MARNEEKQLARLNRFYLQQHKEEELRKRPPRPRLETLSSLDDIKKWIPSILKDIEFYVKQMEVSCYPKKTIEEFERRINQLRGEYKAFVRKAHELEPDISATPWSDRPYSSKRQKLNTISLKTISESEKEIEQPAPPETEPEKQGNPSSTASFVPLSTPLLLEQKSYTEFYGNRKSEHLEQSDINTFSQDQPLDLNFSSHNKLALTDSSVSALLLEKDNAVLNKNGFQDSGKTSMIDNYSSTSLYSLKPGMNSVRRDKDSVEVNTSITSHTGPVCQSLNLPYKDSSSDDDT